MSVQIGIVPIVAIILAFFTKRNNLFWYFIAVLALCILFMLPVSAPLWELVKPLQLIQYPWRLLSFVIPISGFCAAFWAAGLKNKRWGLLLAVLAVILAASYARPVLYAPRSERYYMSRPNFVNGTSSMGNSFSTIWTGWKSEQATASAGMTHTLYFPGWKAYVDNREAHIQNINGVIFVPSAGNKPVSLRFTETPVRTIADIISIITVGILVFI
jgi:uncharacterized membrane protein YfhO